MDKIRFLGSENKISRVPFGSILKETREKTTVENEDTLLSCAINGIFRNDELFSHFRGSSTIGYIKVKKNDLILSAQNLHLGNANVNLRFEHGIISPAYKVYRITGAEPEYIAQWVKRPAANQFFLAATTEGASQCRKNIDWDALYRQPIVLPSSDEQKKIAKLLMSLDFQIAFEKTEVRKLKDFKSAMLTKMFPKEDKTEPEIRFPGFTDAWEQRKISELAEKTYGGGTPTTSNEAFWNGNIPWIQSSDIVDGKLMGVEPRKYITQTALNSSATQLVPKDSIAIITRVGVGKLAYMPFSYSTSQDFLSLSKLNTEPFFTVYACYKKLQSELNMVQGTSIKGITKDELLAKTISVPVYSEQKQIGSFFTQLDPLITLHQRKHEKLIDTKRAFLEKLIGGEK